MPERAPDHTATLVGALVLAAAVAVAVLDHRRALGAEAWAPVALALAGAWVLRPGRLAWGAVVVAAALAAPRRLPGPAGRDVVLITVDTFRADHLDPARTPRLWGLGGARFTHAFSPIPLTAPAHATMWTGEPPWSHGLTRNGATLGPVETAAERARARGWHTGAFLGARVLDASTGLDIGFDHYDDRFDLEQRVTAALGGLGGPHDRDGAEVVDRAIAWWRATSGPRLLWVHLYDAHLPYTPEVAPPADAVARANAEDRGASVTVADLEGRHAALGRLLYAAEIAEVDGLVGRVLDAVGPDAVVIVSGDHGEALGEHGYWFNHGALLHDPALAVPLIVRDGGPARIDDRLVGIDAVAGLVDAAVEGRPLVVPASPTIEAWTPGQQNRRGLLPGAGPVAARRTTVDKVVLDRAGARRYDLVADPGELSPAGIPDDPALRARLHPTVAPPTDDERARLEALGYVSP